MLESHNFGPLRVCLTLLTSGIDWVFIFLLSILHIITFRHLINVHIISLLYQFIYTTSVNFIDDVPTPLLWIFYCVFTTTV